ncbi:MAG: NAD(P)H-dependent flavin oxidoreductase [Pseudomonadota bacterium]
MPLPSPLSGKLRLPVIASPMFLVSGPRLVIAACKAGVIGSFPSLNARPAAQYDAWLGEIETALARHGAAHPDALVAPFAVNQIVHRSNSRLAEDLAITYAHKVPLVITSVGHPGDIAARVHAYGGLVFHDVINLRHAEKAIEAGVDGIIMVCAGAGGHAGLMNPFTIIPQLRKRFAGTIILAGAISDGRAVWAAQVLGADLAYMGTRFIATQESEADDAYKRMLIEANSADIVYTDKISGISGNFLRQSLEAAGVDVQETGAAKTVNMDLSARRGHGEGARKEETGKKAWKEVWSAGQGVGQIEDTPTVAALVERLARDYEEARANPVL